RAASGCIAEAYSWERVSIRWWCGRSVLSFLQGQACQDPPAMREPRGARWDSRDLLAPPGARRPGECDGLFRRSPRSAGEPVGAPLPGGDVAEGLGEQL